MFLLSSAIALFTAHELTIPPPVDVNLANAHGHWRFVPSAYGLSLDLAELAQGQAVQQFSHGPLFRLQLGAPGQLAALVPGTASFSWTTAFSEGSTTLTMRWNGLSAGPDSYDVTITWTLPAASAQLAGRITVAPVASVRPLAEIDFPSLELMTKRVDPDGEGGMAPIATDRLAWCVTQGMLFDDPIELFDGDAPLLEPANGGDGGEGDFGLTFANPGRISAPLAAYSQVESGESFYLAAHDPTGAAKRVRFASDGTHLRYRMTHLPEHNEEAGFGFSMGFDAVMTPFLALDRHAWFDACQIYRDFALQQAWCAQGPWKTRADTPAWLRSQDHVSVFKDSDELDVESLPYAEMGANWPALLDDDSFLSIWYGWDAPGFLVDVPFGYPAIDDFQEAVDLAHASGGRVLPYLNGTEFTLDGTEYASRNAETTIVVLGSDGNPIKFDDGGTTSVTCCQGASAWHDAYADAALRLQADHEVDGVYLDFWAGLDAITCQSLNHGHPRGGGSWWTAGKLAFAQNLRNVLRAARPDAITYVEEQDESVIGVVDLMASRPFENVATIGHVQAASAPMFQTLYHEFIATSCWGRIAPSSEMDSLDSRAHVAGCAHYGLLLNLTNFFADLGDYSDLSTADEAAFAGFLGEIARSFDFGGEYLKFGRRMRPPEVTGAETIPVTMEAPPSAPWPLMAPEEFHATVPLTSTWRAADGSIGIYFVNWAMPIELGGGMTLNSLDVTVTFDPTRYGFASSDVLAFSLLTDSGEINFPGSFTGTTTRTLPVPMGAALLFKVRKVAP